MKGLLYHQVIPLETENSFIQLAVIVHLKGSIEWGSLVGCHLWGRTELDMTEVT